MVSFLNTKGKAQTMRVKKTMIITRNMLGNPRLERVRVVLVFLKTFCTLARRTRSQSLQNQSMVCFFYCITILSLFFCLLYYLGSQPSLLHHNSTNDVQQRSSITSASPQHPPSSIFQKTSPMKQDSSVVASPAHYQSPPDMADDHFSAHNHFSLERQPSPSGSSVCSSGTTPPLYPTAPPSSKFKDLLLPPPASSGGRRSSLGSQRSTGSSQDDHHVPGHAPSRSSSELNLKEKYGNVSNVLGKGAFATVKLCCPVGSKEKYAVKEFRKKKKDESTVSGLLFLNACLNCANFCRKSISKNCRPSFVLLLPWTMRILLNVST